LSPVVGNWNVSEALPSLLTVTVSVLVALMVNLCGTTIPSFNT
jgi:hypothetical protein